MYDDFTYSYILNLNTSQRPRTTRKDSRRANTGTAEITKNQELYELFYILFQIKYKMILRLILDLSLDNVNFSK